MARRPYARAPIKTPMTWEGHRGRLNRYRSHEPVFTRSGREAGRVFTLSELERGAGGEVPNLSEKIYPISGLAIWCRFPLTGSES